MSSSHDTVAALLAAWRADIEDSPQPVMPLLDAALERWYEMLAGGRLPTTGDLPRPQAVLDASSVRLDGSLPSNQ